MSRLRRPAKPLVALIAFGALALALSGCVYFKPNSLQVSQPGGIGPARVHFVLCTEPTPECKPNKDSDQVQYLLGIAVPPGSTPPQTLTATPVGGGSSIVFTRNDEVGKEFESASPSLQAFLSQEGETPEEKEEIEEARQILGGPFPPSGLQGVGYLSEVVQETEGATIEWSIDGDFGLPLPADGSAYAGPFATGVAFGIRGIAPDAQANRPVHCARFDGSAQPEDSALCGGTNQQKQVGTSDLRIAAPAKSTGVFVGGKVPVSFGLSFASTAPAAPAIVYTATSTLKGAKATAAANGKVTVTVPKNAKPGTYEVTLTGTAQVPNGASSSAVAKIKVTKPKLKLGGVKLNKSNGTATLSVKVPGAGTLTATGHGRAVRRLVPHHCHGEALAIFAPRIANAGTRHAHRWACRYVT